MKEITNILSNIIDLQVKSTDKYYCKGLFPSVRYNNTLKIKREDDNIFFTASIAYILSVYKEFFNDEDKIKVNNTINNYKQCIDLYINKPERMSFNFWQKKPNKHFPYGNILSKISKFQLPDDIDSTAMIQMSCNMPIDKAKITKQCIGNYANGSSYRVKNGHPDIRKYKAYSTWFGKKMPIELDVCVLSNYLLWLDKYNFSLTENDCETIDLIKYVIKEKLYFSHPFSISPEYPRTPIILYHLARCAARTKYFKDVKNDIVFDIKNIITSIRNDFEKMYLQSTLLLLNEKVKLDFNYEDINNKYSNAYWWYTAGLLSVYSNKIIMSIAPNKLFHLRFVSQAFNKTLILENMILNNQSFI